MEKRKEKKKEDTVGWVRKWGVTLGEVEGVGAYGQNSLYTILKELAKMKQPIS